MRNWGLLVGIGVALAGGCDGGEEADAGIDAGVLADAGIECARSSDCDDGQFCNGVEACAGNECVDGPPPCEGTCDEATDACACDVEDADGDGALSIACGGDDCDDADPLRYPGSTEVCDTGDVDEDCDPDTFGELDADGDSFVSATCCNGTTCGDDCDDGDPAIHPGVAEACDGVDQDCDGLLDEGATVPRWPDEDGDGWGDDDVTPEMGCLGTGFADRGGDCDDTTSSVSPAVAETCNGVDDDCDGMFDGPGEDDDADGYADASCGGDDCDDSEDSIHPLAAEVCDGVDQDCDGRADWPIAEVCVPCISVLSAAGCAGGQVCCDVDPVTATCSDEGCPVDSNVIECDGPEDCAAGERCCGSASRSCQTSCASGGAVACHSDADCDADFVCPPPALSGGGVTRCTPSS